MEEYLPIVRKFGDPIFMLTAEVYFYIAKAFLGDQEGFHTAIKLINVCFDVGFKAFAVTMAPFISELYFQTGDHESTLRWIKKMLDHVNKTGSYVNNAELHRIKALTLQALNKPDTLVEENLNIAINLARTQKAKTFELRAASDIAKLWQSQGKNKEACELLSEVYNWFEEGLESVDLIEARRTLDDIKNSIKN